MNSNVVYNGNRISCMFYSRRIFDPNEKNDLKEYAQFLKNGKWVSGCPFYLEWPYLTVPDMIKDKIVRNMLL